MPVDRAAKAATTKAIAHSAAYERACTVARCWTWVSLQYVDGKPMVTAEHIACGMQFTLQAQTFKKRKWDDTACEACRKSSFVRT